MSEIETYYFIDFENINNDERLKGLSSLGRHDHVHLFYTDNARRINLDIFHGSIACEFSVHKVPVNKQSLDMHLVSYLGYLLGSNPDSGCSYVIISDDTDYDNIIAFWKANTSQDISRRSSIIVEAAKPKAEPKKKTDKPKETASDKKSSLNVEIMQALRQANYPADIANKVSSLAVSHLSGEAAALSNIHNQLRAGYSDYTGIYQIVKPIFNKYAPSAKNTKSTSSASDITGDIQKKLRDSDFPDAVADEVASLVCKYHSQKNGKQTIYRNIVSKYGREKGLTIYNHIKKEIKP